METKELYQGVGDAGVAAGIEFDTASGPPIVVHEFTLEGKPNE